MATEKELIVEFKKAITQLVVAAVEAGATSIDLQIALSEVTADLRVGKLDA